MRLTATHFKALCFGAAFCLLGYFIHNPFFDSCTFSGCNYGKGFPLPFYFDTFCPPGSVLCAVDYFSGATFLFDFSCMAFFFFAVMRIYQWFSGYTDDPDLPLYKIQR